jgi:hypothetical protein
MEMPVKTAIFKIIGRRPTVRIPPVKVMHEGQRKDQPPSGGVKKCNTI